MRTNTLRAAFVMTIAVFLLSSCTSREGGSISVNGNIVEIKTSEHTMKALKGVTEEGTYVVMSANAIPNPSAIAYLDGRLTLLPKDDYDRFMKLHANPSEEAKKEFREIRKRLRRVNVIAEDRPIQKKIRELIRNAQTQPYPVVTLTMTELLVIDLKHKSDPVHLSGELTKNYLVTKIKMGQG